MGWSHELVKKESRKRILDALALGSATFSELLKRAKVSRATLNSHLKDFMDEGIIEREYTGPRKLIIKLVRRSAKGVAA